MWKKIVFFAAIICCSYNAMADSYAKQLKDKITKIEKRSDIDPDSFAIDIKTLENELAKLNTEGIKMSSEKLFCVVCWLLPTIACSTATSMLLTKRQKTNTEN